MEVPLQISWRDMEKSEALEADIRRRAKKLEEFFQPIISCRIMVEKPHGQHHKGNLYHIRIDLKVPDKEIVVIRDPADNHAHEDAYVSVRDAFDATKRQLQDYARVRRGENKQHDVLHNAKVVRRFPAQDYGFLLTPDGRDIYFHRNALMDGDFDMLDEGTEVSYAEEMGDKGPQAKRVLLGKHKNPGVGGE
ncbi:MAG: HPF/RaiA family ribosome-associated protein [Pseudohongiellaceae bacterium]